MVLAISLIVASMCASLVVLAYYHRIIVLDHKALDRLNFNVQSGLQYLQANIDQIPSGEPIILDLYGEGRDSVVLEKRTWGHFYLAISESRHRGQTQRLVTLIGNLPEGAGQSALYLADDNDPLYMVGDARIRGNAHLPPAGVRNGYVNARGFAGKKLVEGQISASTNSLPPLNSTIAENLDKYLSAKFDFAEEGDELKNGYSNSFYNTPVYFSCPDHIKIDQKISGNVILYSEKKVTITGNAELNDVIVVAPEVRMESGFVGSVQLVASDTVIIQSRCKLKYPSSISLISSREQALIEISGQATLEGMIYLDGRQTNYKNRLLRLEQDTMVSGSIYCNGFVETKGEVWGDIICRKFLLITKSAVYENYLFDGKIDRTMLAPGFVLGSLWGDYHHSGVVKQLY